ncbi:MAG: glutamine--fructose-6-phosphate transaminase (isomerizing) [Opitutales bacterium]|nr:glutamine--fructose-6-phosphate transaminase (isomerizing) [Opitutales bacterium]MCH8541443.1 glutamine--fructose-6-phosphate transaminase (isomerizing) [Opitutales bacterium]
MCGIIGYIGKQKAAPILIEGLKRLEYRGYDSAGLALSEPNGLFVCKKTGRVENLAQSMMGRSSGSTRGISHTRWATHGGVSDENAHPHLSSDGAFALTHNGVIENFGSIKKFLLSKGYTFQSQTDSEVLVNLIAYHYAKEPKDGDHNPFLEAVRRALFHVEGTYGIAVMCQDFPDQLVGARKGSPLILGVGKEEFLLASDVAALITHTQNVVYLKDNEIVSITPDSFHIANGTRENVSPIIDHIDWKIEDSEMGSYAHFMEKEIFEQPAALENSMRGRFSDDNSTANFGGLNLSAQELRQVDRILFCGCGTAWHACLIAEYLIERYARIPVEVEYASEFRYRNAPLDKNTLVFVISQSGETIDTLAALREAKRKGYRTMAIVNTVGSTIARESDGGIYQHIGPEIGVASTKAFTSQLLVSAMIALYLGRLRDMSFTDGRDFTEALKSLPELVSRTLELAPRIKEIASEYKDHADFLFLGRQSLFPIALEGALKLKEISYIHAEGYPAAEMKHGPIALISEDCPSVFLAPQDDMFHKVLGNMQEVKARGGKIIAIGSEEAEFPEDLPDHLLRIPECHPAVLPILATIPLQLLSYYIALEKGCDVDKPRNLAKSVTVE